MSKRWERSELETGKEWIPFGETNKASLFEVDVGVRCGITVSAGEIRVYTPSKQER
jgi:hypothetical protein